MRLTSRTGGRTGVVAALVASLAVACALLPGRAEAQDARPNILVFVTDDQRAVDTMGVMPLTRRYFQRRRHAVHQRFRDDPALLPVQGDDPHGSLRPQHRGSPERLEGFDDSTIFPRLLVSEGYRTAMVGKFLNGWKRRRVPYFDHWALLKIALSKYTRPWLNVDGETRRFSGYLSTDLLARYSVDFLERFDQEGDDAPWFLYVAPSAPHYPWTPAPRHARAPVPGGGPAVLEKDRSDKPAYVRQQHYALAEAQRVRTGQLRALMSVDEMVGRIFRKLEELGEKRETLAIFTSDNGFLWADHGIGGEASTAGQKRVPYSASVRVPFFLRWPGRVGAGGTDRRLVGNVDIAPTVLSAAGIAPDPAKPPLDGRSLLDSGRRGRMLLEYWKEPGRPIPTWASLRTRRFQYVEYYRDGRRVFREYYNLLRGPWQLRNLLADGPEQRPVEGPPGEAEAGSDVLRQAGIREPLSVALLALGGERDHRRTPHGPRDRRPSASSARTSSSTRRPRSSKRSAAWRQATSAGSARAPVAGPCAARPAPRPRRRPWMRRPRARASLAGSSPPAGRPSRARS